MLFRFGWKKDKQKLVLNNIEADVEDVLSEENPPVDTVPFEPVIVNIQPNIERTRIILLGDQEEISGLYYLYLRSKGYDVFHFLSPITCALLIEQICTCPRDHVCADIIITQMDMETMSGLDLLRYQSEKGCHALAQNKAIIAAKLTEVHVKEAGSLGCKMFQKPFRLVDLMTWIQDCEKRIPVKRKLTPLDELIKY